MSLHAGQEKKLLRGQIIIAKVTLERAPDQEAHLEEQPNTEIVLNPLAISVKSVCVC